jgi:hypothetical protein
MTMIPRLRVAGIAGILAGVGLAIEFALFMTSGWTAETFGDPVAALDLLQRSGIQLRAAGFAGALNLAFATILIVGLAARLSSTAPTSAAATLYLGLIGVAGESLVPLSLWLGIPMFLGLATRDPQIASGAWGGFAAFLGGAGAVGYLFSGLSLVAAGWAIVSHKALPSLVGWAGLVAGLASVVNVLGAQTPLDALAAAAFLPALLLNIVFRVGAGYTLWRENAELRLPSSPTDMPLAAGMGR